MVGVAQLVRALDCDSRGREFEPHHPPHNFTFIGVSPSGKARDFDSRMRWFESSHSSHSLVVGSNDSLAQLAEHLTFNQVVPSSSLGWVTNKWGVAKW